MVRSPPGRGKGPQALGWVEQQRTPPRRSATAWSLLKTPPSRHPSQGGDFQETGSHRADRPYAEQRCLCRAWAALKKPLDVM